VVLAEDQSLLRDALTAYLATDAGVELVATAGDADGVIDAVERLRPDVAIVDVRMPGGGPSAAREISTRAPGTSVIAFSAHDDDASRAEMFAAGAVEYVVKGQSPGAILESIHSVARRASEPSSSPRGEAFRRGI
jgi:DNA-binding NarL/FixJ family response regulator